MCSINDRIRWYDLSLKGLRCKLFEDDSRHAGGWSRLLQIDDRRGERSRGDGSLALIFPSLYPTSSAEQTHVISLRLLFCCGPVTVWGWGPNAIILYLAAWLSAPQGHGPLVKAN